MLASLRVRDHDHGVGLRQTLQTLHQTRQIAGVLGLHSHTHDGGHGELHHLDGHGGLAVGQRGLLQDVLVHTHQTARVTARNISHLLHGTTHHNHGTLHRLDQQIALVLGAVLGSQDAHLLARADDAGEHTTEGVETGLVGGGHHLRHVHHQAAVGVALLHRGAGLVVLRSVVQQRSTVLLRVHGGRQVQHDHLQQSVGSGQPLRHHALHQRLVAQVLLLGGQRHAQRVQHLHVLLRAALAQRAVQTVHGVQHELHERALQRLLALSLALVLLVRLRPLLVVRVEEVVAPQTLHHLRLVDAELLRVQTSELTQSETPLLQTGAESHRTLVRVHLDVAHSLVGVRRDDHVHRLHGLHQLVVRLLGVQLKLRDHTIQLVAHQHGADTLSQRLAQHGLGLDAHSTDGIHHHQSTIGHTKGGSDLGREIDVSRRVDQVDQVGVLLDLNILLRHVSLLVGVRGGSHGRLLIDRLGIVLEVQRNTGRLDGNATLLLISTGIRETGVTSRLLRDNTGLRHESISKGGLTVIDVSDHRKVTNVVGHIHHMTDLIDGEVDLRRR